MCSYYFAALDILLVIFIKLRYSFNSFFLQNPEIKNAFWDRKNLFPENFRDIL